MKSAALTQKQIKKLPAHAFSRAEYYEKGQLKDVYFTPDLRRTSFITVERMLQRLRARALKSKYAIKYFRVA